MRYQLDIALTEDDAIEFEAFHLFKTKEGKAKVRKARMQELTVLLILIATVLIISGWTKNTALYVILVVIYDFIRMLLYKKIIYWRMKRHLKKLNKAGTLLANAVSKYEFYEDSLVEINEGTRIEQSYSKLQCVRVVENRYILLCPDDQIVYVLPISQLTAQVDKIEFLNFITQKCNTVEYY
ncbi:MAG: hypothetical protein IKU57_04100 [Oscillospiraceae bacterium]|nr:hypothetical protein [Oscillospiraceae bacterium]